MNTKTTSKKDMPAATMQAIARYFNVLSEPTRLAILNELRDGARNVGELAQLCGYTAANISRHLSLMSQQGIVARESQGNSAYYHITDPAVYDLCELVCDNIARHLEEKTATQNALLQEVAQMHLAKE